MTDVIEAPSRIVDVNQIHVGHEPSFKGKLEVNQIDLMRALNWYSSNKSYDDSATWFTKRFPDVSKDATSVITNMGFIVRLMDRGLPVDADLEKRVHSRYIAALEFTNAMQPTVAKVKKSYSYSGPAVARDELLDTIIGDINCAIDDIITTGKADTPKILDVVKPAQRKVIVEFCKNFIASVESDQLDEEEPGCTKRDANNIVKLLSDLLHTIDKTIPSRKLRVKKAYTPERIMRDFKAKFVEGVKPTKIIGAKAALVYDNESRHIMLIEGAADGLSVKGSTIINIAESTSIRKKLRKPEDVIPTLKGMTYRNTIALLKAVRATEQSVRPRVSEKHVVLAIW